jgi:hypothetical protein
MSPLPRERIEYADILIFNDEKHIYTTYRSLTEFQMLCYMIKHGHEVIFNWRPQKLRFDIDAKPDQATQDEIYTLARQIIDKTLEIYRDNYYIQTFTDYEPTDFLVTQAFGPNKLGCHIIAPFYMRTSTDALMMAKEVLAALADAPLIHLVDDGIYKTTQNFRLFGCAKSEDPTRRKLHWDRFPTQREILPHHYLIGHYDPYEREFLMTISLTGEQDPPLRKYDISMPDLSDDHNSKLDSIIEPYLQSFSIRGRSGNKIVFNRLEPTYCDLCDTTHDHDNTMYMTIGPSDSRPVYLRCFRTSRSRIIGHLGDSTPGQYIEKVVALPEQVLAIPTIIPIKQSETIYDSPNMQPLPLHHTIFLKAPMKMGKTSKCMIPFMREHFAGKSIYMITFRQTFTKSIENTLAAAGITDFISYQDIQTHIITAPRLIIQVESLSRIQMGSRPPPDLIIMDESESIIEQFLSGNVRDLGCAFAVFQWLIKYSPFVLAMDANLGERTKGLIARIRATMFDSDPVFIHNKYKNATGDTYKIVKFYDTWLATLISRVEEGMHVAIFSNSLSDAKAIERLCIEKFGARRRIQLYSSETSMQLKSKHFADVNHYWSQVDILICTPTVSAGISFEVAHFQAVFGLFTDQSCTVETSRQMIGRIRTVSEFYIHFRYSLRELPTDLNTIKLYLTYRRNLLHNISNVDATINFEYNENGEPELEITPFILMCMLNIRINNLSRNQFIKRFISQLREIGAQIEVINETPATPLYAPTITQLKNTIKVEQAATIADAQDITDEEAVEIQSRIEKGFATDRELIELEKNIIQTTYNVRDEVTQQFVLDFGEPQQREQFKALKTIYLVNSGAKLETLLEYIRPTPHNYSLARATTYEKHVIACRILRILGFQHPFDISTTYPESVIMTSINNNTQELLRIFSTYAIYFNLELSSRQLTPLVILKNCNTIINFYSNQIRRKKGSYCLHYNFKFDPLLRKAPYQVLSEPSPKPHLPA